ncbi:UNVERIFIED_CONTAM: C9orf16 [Trichonephila clavipes]
MVTLIFLSFVDVVAMGIIIPFLFVFSQARAATYMQLNQELDEINNCLDALEKKNDNLHEELYKLLEENRQIRSEIKEEFELFMCASCFFAKFRSVQCRIPDQRLMLQKKLDYFLELGCYDKS